MKTRVDRLVQVSSSADPSLGHVVRPQRTNFKDDCQMPDVDSEREKIRRLIQDAGVAILMTVDDRGDQAGRPMLPMMRDNDPHIYFLSHSSSRKLTQVAAHPQVGLTITTPHCYIVVTGRADVLRDREIVSQLWNPTYRAWFPEGEDDREAAVLRVIVGQVNYWEPPRSSVVRLAQGVKAVLTHKAVETPMKTIDRL